MVNGKIVLTVFKITWAKIWCPYNAPSKYSKPWQWHKKLTSFPYGNQILMQTNWGKKFQPHSDFVCSRKQAKLFDTLACLYEVKKWSFLIHLFFLGGRGGEEVNFTKVCLCFQQRHSFQKRRSTENTVFVISVIASIVYTNIILPMCRGDILFLLLLPWWWDSLTILRSHWPIENSILHSIDGSLCWLLKTPNERERVSLLMCIFRVE